MDMHFPESEDSTPALPEPSAPPRQEVNSFYRRPPRVGTEPTGMPQVSNGGFAL